MKIVRPPVHRPWARGPLAAAVFALAAGLADASPAPATGIAQTVYAIEAAVGNDPLAVIQRLQPLESGARASGGDDLRAFLAAWGYAHGATDKPAVADAAVEELTDLGERSHDPAALASAYTLKASLLQFAGQPRAAFAWIQGALPLVEQTASPDLRYWVDSVAADLAQSNGQLVEAIRLFEAAAVAARDNHNPRREAQAYLGLSPLRLVHGENGAALRDAALVRELGGRANDAGLVVAGWVMESFAATADGQPTRGAQARATALALQRRLPGHATDAAGATPWLEGEQDALSTFAELYLALHDWPQAHDFAARALASAQAHGDLAIAADAQFDLGLADLGAGHLQQGRDEADAGLHLMAQRRDAAQLVQLNRYADMLERVGATHDAMLTLRAAQLLDDELARRDRKNTVVALQRQSSFEQHQRQVEQLEHDNALQSVEIARRTNERTFGLLLAAAMGIGGVVAWRQYLRARQSNRQLADINAELAHASLHDKVTDLLNRRAMEADTQAIEASGRGAYCNITISVKQFGLIVGSVGHQLGDTLLCQIASRLDRVVRRAGGKLYRVDGVTFGALLEFGRDAARLQALLASLCGAMEAPFEIGNQDLIVSIGVGASEYPKDAGSAQEVARLAELAKLQAHADAGNSWLVYDTRIGESQRDKLRLESRMLKALEHGDFELFYQGQRGLPDGRICGFEALLRWRDGDKMISPAEFIPLAEESGLIVRIGAWVLDEACRQAKAWADSGAGRPLVAVNISPRQFNHPDFLATVRETLRKTGVDPRQIELEITEGSVMDDAEASIAQLHALRALGLHLAIDDFGTGYASLSYLRRFPLDRLKIDRSFIQQLNASRQDDTIVRTVIELAHTLGLSVTAEGVETLEQEAVLERWGCNVIQGFLRFRPAPADAATAALEKERRESDVESVSIG